MLKGPRKFLNSHSGEVLPEVHHVSGVEGFEVGPGENYFNSFVPQICTVRECKSIYKEMFVFFVVVLIKNFMLTKKIKFC